MENEDEQKHNTNDAGTSTNCDTNVHTNVQNEVHRYVIRIHNKYVTKTLCHYESLLVNMKISYKDYDIL